jgi:hypothetical protein
MNKEQVDKEIENYGYISLTPKKVIHSFYKLKDDTIISAYIHPHGLLKGKDQLGEFVGGGTTNVVAAYVPPDKRDPTKFKPYQPSEITSNIEDDDMGFEPLLEEFCEYETTDGKTMFIKTTVSRIIKSQIVNERGEPIYNVHLVPVMKFK